MSCNFDEFHDRWMKFIPQSCIDYLTTALTPVSTLLWSSTVFFSWRRCRQFFYLSFFHPFLVTRSPCWLCQMLVGVLRSYIHRTMHTVLVSYYFLLFFSIHSVVMHFIFIIENRFIHFNQWIWKVNKIMAFLLSSGGLLLPTRRRDGDRKSSVSSPSRSKNKLIKTVIVPEIMCSSYPPWRIASSIIGRHSWFACLWQKLIFSRDVSLACLSVFFVCGYLRIYGWTDFMDIFVSYIRLPSLSELVGWWSRHHWDANHLPLGRKTIALSLALSMPFWLFCILLCVRVVISVPLLSLTQTKRAAVFRPLI